MDFVLVPGTNDGAWWFEPVVERRIVLDTHVADVVAAVDALDASERSVVLVGHSYGGLPITAAGDARPDRVAALVYLDAFLPEDGDSAWSLTDDEQRAWYVGDARRTGDGVDPLPFFDEQTRPHPVGTLLQAIRLTGAWRDVPRKVYVEASQWPTATPMRTSIDRAAAAPDVEHLVWDTRHNVMHDGPGRVLELLRSLA